jgi:hypothetical protein
VVTEDGLDEILAEGDQTGNGRGLGKGDKLFVVSSELERRLIEGTGKGDAGSFSAEVSSTGCIGGVEERVALVDGGAAGTLHESVIEVTLEGTEVAKSELGVSDAGLHGGAVDLNGRRASLLVHPFNDGVLGTATCVVSLLSLVKEKESRETLDAHAVGNALVLGSVDFGNSTRRVLSGQNSRGTFVFGSQLLAVAAPWSVEFNK